MAKIDFRKFRAPSLESIAVVITEMITKPASYALMVVKAELMNSRENPDGSQKKRQPIYNDILGEDGKPIMNEIYLVLKDVVSGKIHIHHVALVSYMKYKQFSQQDIKDNKIIPDERDGFALFPDGNGGYVRIPDQEGGEGHKAVLSIFSRLVQSLGLEERTRPEDCDSFVGRTFRGELKLNKYPTKDDAGKEIEKERLKLQPNFKPIPDEELQELLAESEVTQSWS